MAVSNVAAGTDPSPYLLAEGQPVPDVKWAGRNKEALSRALRQPGSRTNTRLEKAPSLMSETGLSVFLF